jgi:hypothetical protein
VAERVRGLREGNAAVRGRFREGETPLGHAERGTGQGITRVGQRQGTGGVVVGGEGTGATAPATDGDDDGEHGAGGDSSGQIQEAGTVGPALRVQQRQQHNMVGLPQ